MSTNVWENVWEKFSICQHGGAISSEVLAKVCWAAGEWQINLVAWDGKRPFQKSPNVVDAFSINLSDQFISDLNKSETLEVAFLRTVMIKGRELEKEKVFSSIS